MAKTLFEYDSDGKIIGKQSVRPDKEDPSKAFLSGLEVDEQHRNQGIGSRLMAAAENLAQGMGLEATKFEVASDNPAISLYQKRGYQIVATKQSKTGQTYYIMEKSL